MTDFAELVLSAKTEGLKRGETALDQLAAEAERTERRTKGATDGASRSFASMGATVAKAAAGAAAALVSFQQASQAVQQARGFQAALAETSTLIEGTAAEMDLLSKSARDLAKEFGTNATQQVSAFYQAISAGADGVAGAIDVLEAANRLAVGGVTDVTTGVDALTTAVNAYAADGLTAAQASDAMFVAMRAGKTTIGELSGSLGQIVPISSAAGVSFDEVTAAIAALTTQGLSTSSAVTGLRQVLAAIIAPTQQAKDAAAAMGIAFNTQALEAQGLAGFLDGVIAATNGNQEAMSKLFGSVEALNAVLSFAGGGGERFAGILVDMGQKAGATQEAYDKMASGLDQRWNRAVAAGTDIALGIGNVLLTVAVPALEATAAAMNFAVENADFFAASIGILAATRIPALIGGLAATAAALTTIQAQFIAGALAAKGMALAMSAIPLVAAAAGLTMLYREYQRGVDAARAYASALDGLAGAQDNLNDATTRYYEDISQANLNAMRASAEASVQMTRAALEAAQEDLSARRGRLGASIFGMKGIREAEDNVDALAAKLLEAEARLSAVDHAQSNFNRTQADTATTVDETTGSIEALREAMDGLTGSFGGGTGGGGAFEGMAREAAVLERAMRGMAEFNAASAIQSTVSEVSALVGEMGLAEDVAGDLRAMLSDISADDPFDRQAAALADVVSYLDVATGGAQNMNAAALAVYDALLRSLNTAISLSQVPISAGIDPAITSAAQLAHQFGIAYGYAAALAKMQVSTQKLTFGGAVQGSAADSNPFVGQTPLSFSTQSFDIPKITIPEPTIPAIGGGTGGGTGGGSRGRGGGGRSGGAGGESEEMRERNRMMEEGERLTESLRTEQEKYNDAVAQADRLLDAGAITMETYTRHIDDLDKELAETQWGHVVDQITRVSDALVDAMMAGEDMGEAFKATVREMAAEWIKAGLRQLISSTFSGIGGGGGGGFLGAVFGGLFGGARASGGPVQPGKAYLVGERGPELVVPNGHGTVIPNHALGQMAQGGGTFSITVNVEGARGDEHIISLVNQGVSRGMAQVQRAMPDQIEAHMADRRVRY